MYNLDKLRHFRKEIRRMTLQEFSDELSLERGTLYTYECGHAIPSPENIIKIYEYTRGRVTYEDFAKHYLDNKKKGLLPGQLKKKKQKRM